MLGRRPRHVIGPLGRVLGALFVRRAQGPDRLRHPTARRGPPGRPQRTARPAGLQLAAGEAEGEPGEVEAAALGAGLGEPLGVIVTWSTVTV